ncbi:MAG: magnesium-translocating P-type ATPase [Flavisolibacter sp.]
MMWQPVQEFWTLRQEDLFTQLQTSLQGLTRAEASRRLKIQRGSQKIRKPWHNDLRLLFAQFKSPLVLLLVFAVGLSLVLGEYADSAIILTVLLAMGFLGFFQERNAGRAVQKLRELVHSRAAVRRDQQEIEIPVEEVVPGDIVLLNAGDMIPADAFILEANDLHVNESVLTGESYPVEKFGSSLPRESLTENKNAVFKGTSVVNGTAVILAVNTAGATELGKISSSLERSVTITAFEKGIMQFGYLLMRMTMVFTGLILILNMILHRSFIESLLFSLALTVGLTPELLPAILTITLSAGARRMAAKKVIVKKLSAIQNLGGVDILCSDKTGTITEGVVKIKSAIDAFGQENRKVWLYGWLNALYETGFSNPVDEELRRSTGFSANGFVKYDEVPYDFIRKRLSVVVGFQGRHLMITKGAVSNVLDVCTKVEAPSGEILPIEDRKAAIITQMEQFSSSGFRTIALAYKDVTGDPVINKDDEMEMVFLGFLIFFDPPKQGIIQSIGELKKTGISLKIITGDNVLIAAYLAREVGLESATLLSGNALHNLTDEALARKVEAVDVFAEILPAQKERIVRALQKAGHSVAYLGDGINDANALAAADVGISINNAVDVAKEAADLVLLEQNIDVIKDGVNEGRKTFMNTLKYIFVSTSANFGNMFSMATASLILPFLPLLPMQILLNNFLSDLPAISIASDRVDKELISEPRHWDMKFIWRFMLVFGLQSSFFDFLTFGLLHYYFHASPTQFRTAWFMESILTQILILLVIRTRRPFFKSSPSPYLLIAASFTFAACISLPYLPFAHLFQLFPLPYNLLLWILLIVAVYLMVAELSKKYLIGKL